MSHRVNMKTQIKNADRAKEALKLAGCSYRESGGMIHITSGGLENVSIDLTSGNISGDSDYGHTAEKIGILRQHYTEAERRYVYLKEGVTIESRSMDEKGRIVLACRMA